MLFFFFKQKTAYEMRISDWSSDVCSSDLRAGLGPVPAKLVLAPSMERFVRDGMGIEISTEIGSTSDLALKVARGELDFLIASLAEDSPIEGIETTPVGTMPLALLARHDHPVLAAGQPGAESQKDAGAGNIGAVRINPAD